MGGSGKSTDTSTQEADLARQRAEVERLENEAAAKQVQSTWTPNTNDLRSDGSRKGNGWLGHIPTSDGGIMTEKTAEMEVDGKTLQFPLIHPGSTKEELSILSRGGKLPKKSVIRALDHAVKRMKAGLSPYKD